MLYYDFRVNYCMLGSCVLKSGDVAILHGTHVPKISTVTRYDLCSCLVRP